MDMAGNSALEEREGVKKEKKKKKKKKSISEVRPAM
jgi:hypothetical protein